MPRADGSWCGVPGCPCGGPPPMPPALGYCKICRKKLDRDEVELCTRCLNEEVAGPMD
jgi:hypothetical protein